MILSVEVASTAAKVQCIDSGFPQDVRDPNFIAPMFLIILAVRLFSLCVLFVYIYSL